MSAAEGLGKSDGKAIYNQTCISCHGADGKGTLPGAPDFTLLKGPLAQSDDVANTEHDLRLPGIRLTYGNSGQRWKYGFNGNRHSGATGLSARTVWSLTIESWRWRRLVPDPRLSTVAAPPGTSSFRQCSPIWRTLAAGSVQPANGSQTGDPGGPGCGRSFIDLRQCTLPRAVKN